METRKEWVDPMRFAAAVLFLLVGGISQLFAQGNSSAVSQAQARAIIESQRRMNASIAKWNVAKKLTLREDKKRKNLSYQVSGNTSIDELKIGDVGLLAGWDFDVLQVIDETNCLLVTGSQTIWLTNYPTNELVDGDNVRLIDPVKIQEPRRYDSSAGTKKVVCVSMLDPIESKAWEEEYEKKKADLARALKNKEAGLEEFLLRDGEKFFGKFLEYRSSGVIFQDETGKRVRKQLKDFTADSESRIREMMKKSKK